MNILHTADVHLDRAYSGAGMTASIASARRQELRDAFRRFIDLALELQVDAVTIGGDLYEHERSTPDTGNFIAGQFARLGAIPVLVSPGNHDPVAPDSLWRRTVWPANVTIFQEPRLQPHRLADNVTVWGAGHDVPDLRDNLLEGFRVPAEGTHVLLFHGSDLHAVPEGKLAHCGFMPDDVARSGAAFALLGHYHGARVYERYAYPGSLEALDFSEAGQHFALRLGVGDGVARPELLPFGSVRYVTQTLDVAGMTTSDDLRAGIAALGDRDAIVRVLLEGALQSDVELDVPALYNACVERFRFLDLIDRTEPAYPLESLAMESTTKGAFVRLMQSRVANASGEEREVAELALRLGLQAFERREVIVP
ncbi:MAG: metallophosphoesterase [Chloroflexota bacterium]